MEIVAGIHLVPGVRWSRVYLIENETMAVVDAGPPWSARSVLDYIRKIGRRPEDLTHILMTHSHPDHAGGVPALIRRTGARLMAHPHDTRTFASQEVHLSNIGLFSRLLERLSFIEGTPVTETLEDGQVLPIHGGITVIHTPGHTPGSVCYSIPDRGVLFSGDTIFSDGSSVARSVPYPRYNGLDYRRSIDRLAALEFDTLCGGHGSPLMTHASDRLRAMLADDPEPPTWGSAIKRRLLGKK